MKQLPHDGDVRLERRLPAPNELLGRYKTTNQLVSDTGLVVRWTE